jgi:ABC-type dipeptide/oligopeptide/nickel transport system permease component
VGKYIIRRLVMAVPVLFGVSVLTFAMLHLVPGDPVRAMFLESGGASEEQIEQVRHVLGLDKPLPVQYWDYITRIFHGDMGRSIISNRAVAPELIQNFPPTLELTLAGMTLAILFGFAMGIIAAISRGRWLDNLTMILTLGGVSMPGFWLGLLLIYVFSVRLHLIPVIGGSPAKQLILPAIALGLQASAVIARLVRSSLLEVLSEQYIMAARAKGLTQRAVISRHALRNALLPVVTIVGLQFGSLLSGAVIIETVFARRGIGRILVEALQARDFPTAQGGVLFVASVYVLVNLCVDLLYGFIDPRITRSA